jgi:hypothetical protein
VDCGSKLNCPQDKTIKKFDFKTLFTKILSNFLYFVEWKFFDKWNDSHCFLRLLNAIKENTRENTLLFSDSNKRSIQKSKILNN